MSWLKSKYIKFTLSLIFSSIILYLLYRKISFQSFIELITLINLYYFSGFILLILIQLTIASFRWKTILESLTKTRISIFRASQLVIGSYSANLIIPAKMGEFVRVVWEKDKEKRKYVLRLVVFEKMLDVFSIYFIYALALSFVINSSSRILLYLGTVIAPLIALGIILMLLRNKTIFERLPSRIKDAMLLLKKLFSEQKLFFRNIVLVSLGLWIIQIGQFILIFLSLNVHPGFIEAYAGNSLAVLAGAFIPSIGGIGPRDAAIVWFFEGLANNVLLTAIGLLSALRIIIPAFMGLPFFFNLTRKS